MKRIALILCAALFIFKPQVSFAEEPATPAAVSIDAGSIIRGVKGALAWKTLKIKVVLDVTEDKRKNETKKRIDCYLRENESGGTDMLLHFLEPAVVRGNVFLSLEEPGGGDRWYMYVMKLRRKMKVSPKEENYMIRNFLALGIAKPRPEEWNFKVVSQSGDAVLIEGKAANKDVTERTGYTDIKLEVDALKKAIVAADFFYKGEKIRSIKVKKFIALSGMELPEVMHLTYYGKEQETEVTLESYELNPNLSEGLFNPARIEDIGY